jgi:hypothetical protein
MTMFIVRDNLSSDAVLEQVDACLRMASEIARGNESVVPAAQAMLQRVGTPDSPGALADSTLGPGPDSELLPRDDVLATLGSALPSHEFSAPADESEAPEPPDSTPPLVTQGPGRGRRRRTGSIL